MIWAIAHGDLYHNKGVNFIWCQKTLCHFPPATDELITPLESINVTDRPETTPVHHNGTLIQ